MNSPQPPEGAFRILCLDGGGSKGAFTLGLLSELEATLGTRLSDHFELIYGTSTGAIIAAYLALGFRVSDIYKNYLRIIPTVMSKWTAAGRTRALREAAYREFGNKSFKDVRCMLAVVATRCDYHRPLIFKSFSGMAHAGGASFEPGFGVPLADCLIASGAASPFFEKQYLTLKTKDNVESTDVIDGGFVANNPALFALIDATQSLKRSVNQIYLMSLGTGNFPAKPRWQNIIKQLWPLSLPIWLLEETLESNANSAEFIRSRVFSGVRTIRINGEFHEPDQATDLLESRLPALERMFLLGKETFIKNKLDVHDFWMSANGQN